MALLYLVAMLSGAFGYRVPPAGWKPAGWAPPPPQAARLKTTRHVNVDRVFGIPQFWLLWAVLCLNVSAGIGVVGMASPMLQEVFGGHLLGGQRRAAHSCATDQRAQVATIGAAFAGLLSLFNIFGRIFWASFSDVIGRKVTYAVFFLLGLVRCVFQRPPAAQAHVALFVALFCYPPDHVWRRFLHHPRVPADLFGTSTSGPSTSRLLTAWSVAGILEPVVVNYIREHQLARGLPPDRAYNMTMYILGGVPAASGSPAPPAGRGRWPSGDFMSDAELAAERATKSLRRPRPSTACGGGRPAAVSPLVVALASRVASGIPLLPGLWTRLTKALPLAASADRALPGGRATSSAPPGALQYASAPLATPPKPWAGGSIPKKQA